MGTPPCRALQMQSQWQRFLAERPNHPAADTLAVDLSALGLLRADGTDARGFLQGQLSTNVTRLTETQGQFSSWNSPRGRVLALLHVFMHDEAIHLALPHDLLASIRQGLGKYVLRAKVTLAEVSEAVTHFGLVGAETPALLARHGLPVPESRWGTASHDGITLMRLHGEVPRFTLFGTEARLIEFSAALDGQVHWRQADDWAYAAILAGEPIITPATSDQFVAQMLNLDALGGIDYKKGCYTGQEIIARAHYRGRVKRHLVQVSVDSNTRLVPGTVIQAAGREAGVLLDAQPAADGTQLGLAVMQEEPLADATLDIAGSASVTIRQIYHSAEA